jgi:hypothetical protein
MAYAVALQLLLVGFALSSFNVLNTSDAAFTICHNGGDQSADGQSAPAGHKDQQSCCIACPLAGFGDLPVAFTAQPIVFRLASDVTFTAFALASLRDTQDHNPRSSQGPPQIA